VPEPITLTAAGLLAMYVTGFVQRAGEKAFEELSEGADSGLRRLYDRVKQRVSGDKYGEAALERVEAQPDDERRQAVLAEVLDEAMAADPGFARELGELVQECKSSLGDRVEIQESGFVAFGPVTQKGKYVAGRDITLGGGGPGSHGGG
jgi:hypothetical protein